MSKTVITDKRTNRQIPAEERVRQPRTVIVDEVGRNLDRSAAQRDDREVSELREELEALKRRGTGLPDGWRYAGSKVVPTADALNDKIELFRAFMDDREGREVNLEVSARAMGKPIDLKKLRSGVKGYFAQLMHTNEYAASGFFNIQLSNMMRSVHFYEVYDKQLEKVDDPDKANEIEIKQSESLIQALVTASALDALMEKDDTRTIDYKKETYNFLVRQGEWIGKTFGQAQRSHKRIKGSTLGGLTARTRQPDEQAELDDDLDAMNAA